MLGWDIPEDFDQTDTLLLFELCMAINLQYENAINCVRLLRRPSQYKMSHKDVYSKHSLNKINSKQEVTNNE
jgi:hypothetical protein